MKKLIASLFLISPLFLFAQNADVSKRADAITQKIIDWRRDFHEHPELGNQEKFTLQELSGPSSDIID